MSNHGVQVSASTDLFQVFALLDLDLIGTILVISLGWGLKGPLRVKLDLLRIVKTIAYSLLF